VFLGITVTWDAIPYCIRVVTNEWKPWCDNGAMCDSMSKCEQHEKILQELKVKVGTA